MTVKVNKISEQTAKASRKNEITLLITKIANGSALEAVLSLLRYPDSVSVPAFEAVSKERKKEIQEVLFVVEGRIWLLNQGKSTEA